LVLSEREAVRNSFQNETNVERERGTHRTLKPGKRADNLNIVMIYGMNVGLYLSEHPLSVWIILEGFIFSGII